MLIWNKGPTIMHTAKKQGMNVEFQILCLRQNYHIEVIYFV